MQISGEGPAFGPMQMVVGRGENRERESVRGRRGEQETRAGSGAARVHCTHARGPKRFLSWFCLSAKL